MSNSDKLLTVSIKSPKREEFNGLAHSITSTNSKGKFDVLPFHTNFITLIKEYIIIREQNNKEITFPIQSGIISVNEDKVHILIGV
jgi:F0F1-type ATP synthase epsilon subunit